jgi:hypothetical protein
VEQFRIAPGAHRPAVLGKALDKASPQLLARLVQGTDIPIPEDPNGSPAAPVKAQF